MSATVVVEELVITVTENANDIATVEVISEGPKGDAGDDFNPWETISIDFEDLAVADTENTIEYKSLLARSVLDKLMIKLAQPWAGGAISAVAISLGIDGEADRHVSLYDGMGTVTDSNFVIVSLNDFFSLTTAKSLKIKAQSTGANLSEATQGRVEIFIKWAELPELS